MSGNSLGEWEHSKLEERTRKMCSGTGRTSLRDWGWEIAIFRWKCWGSLRPARTPKLIASQCPSFWRSPLFLEGSPLLLEVLSSSRRLGFQVTPLDDRLALVKKSLQPWAMNGQKWTVPHHTQTTIKGRPLRAPREIIHTTDKRAKSP